MSDEQREKLRRLTRAKRKPMTPQRLARLAYNSTLIEGGRVSYEWLLQSARELLGSKK